MTREEYKQILELYLTGAHAYDRVYDVLMGNGGPAPVIGFKEGLFGRIEALERILRNHSKSENVDILVDIMTSEKLSLDEKVDMLFGEDEQVGVGCMEFMFYNVDGSFISDVIINSLDEVIQLSIIYNKRPIAIDIKKMELKLIDKQ